MGLIGRLMSASCIRHVSGTPACDLVASVCVHLAQLATQVVVLLDEERCDGLHTRPPVLHKACTATKALVTAPHARHVPNT